MASFQPVCVGIVEANDGYSHHIQEALRELGFGLKLISSAEDFKQAHVVIFSDSGSIELAAQSLQDRGLWSSLNEYLKSGRPYLGVSTGMHVLFENSDDHPELELLGLLPGSVGKLESWDVPVPHMGWNDISCVDPSVVASGGYAEDAPSLYFAHTFCIHPSPENIPHITSVTDYGDQRFISAIVKDNITGVQFHPELSGPTGLNFLKEYIDKLQTNGFAAATGSISGLEDFGELQALPMTMPSVRVAALVNDRKSAAEAFADGADEVMQMHPFNEASTVNTSAFVPIPIAAYFSQGISFESAERHLCSGASRIVVPMDEAMRAVVDFLTTGVATGDTVIERLSRRYGAHAVVVEISAERKLLENPMQPFKRPATSTGDSTALADTVDPTVYDEESFPTLGAAHSVCNSAMDAVHTGGDSGMVQIIAEQDDEHDMLAMLRGMGRTVVHLAEEQADLLYALEDGESETDNKKSKDSLSRMTHCWFSVSVPANAGGSENEKIVRAIDAVVLAKACEILGAGEILLRGTTSDKAFDRPLLNAVQNAVSISVLAAPTTGVSVTSNDYIEVFERTRIKAVAVAPDGPSVREVKESLRSTGVIVR
eukprot:gene8097-9646_t